ncbi:chromosome partitioning protein ParB [Spirochaetia bacterium]|nr:chromosome partitioning protein ParB [Spirochaetia bacterium]
MKEIDGLEFKMTDFRAPMDRIYYDADRKYGGTGDISKLAKSMEKIGLIHPIILSLEDEGQRMRIIAGRRRFEAARLLGWADIKAEIHSADDAGEVSLAENVNREDMNPLDEAELFQKQLADGRDINEVAQYYNRSVSAIYQRIKLLKLTDELKEFYRAGKIKITAAAMLASLDEKLQHNFFKRYKNFGVIDIREVEGFLHSAQHNRLVCMTDSKCKTCTSRTNHSDKNLFPEYNGLEDVCFDDGCYAKKWQAQLAKMIKKERAANPDTRDILVLENIPHFYRGDILTLDEVEYRIKKFNWKNIGHEDNPDSFYVWKFTMHGKKLVLIRECYQECTESSSKQPEKEPKSKYEIGSVVSTVVDEVLKEEFGEETGALLKSVKIKEVDKKLEKKFADEYHFRREIKFALLKKLTRELVDNPRNLTRKLVAAEIEDDRDADIYEMITGTKCTPELADVESIDPLKIIMFLSVMNTFKRHWPDPDDDEEDEYEYEDGEIAVLQLSGLDWKGYMELYSQTARELIDAAMTEADDPNTETGEEDVDTEDEEEPVHEFDELPGELVEDGEE